MKRSKWRAAAAALLLGAALLTGCSDHRQEVVTTSDAFLAAADEGRMDDLGDYASEGVLKQLGWDKATLDSYVDNLASSVTEGTQVDMNAILTQEEIAGKVDELVTIINDVRIQGYTIEESSFAKAQDGGTIKAKVTVLTEDSLEAGLSRQELSEQITAKVYEYIMQDPSILVGDNAQDLYVKVIPAIMPDVLEMVKTQIGDIAGEEQIWQLSVHRADDKWLVTDVTIEKAAGTGSEETK